MPSFLCCSSSTKSLPISPDGTSHTSRSLLSKKGLETSPEGSVVAATSDDMGQRQQHKTKIRLLLNETLLPGQLPDTARGAARVQIVEPEKRKGVPLLEDNLFDGKSVGSQLHHIAGGLLSLSALDVPAQLLCGTSASFDADYRDGELVTLPTSVSDASCGAASECTLVGSPERGALARLHHTAELEYLRQMLQAPLKRAVSRSSGHWRLYKQCWKGSTALPPGGATGPPVAVPSPDAAAAAAAAVEEQEDTASINTGGRPAHRQLSGEHPVSQPCASIALQHLQRELHVAAELPRCPLLLLPHRVYRTPATVHVVYDSAGDYKELYTLLLERKRLSERSCRSILRQILQALATLHSDLWAHRNISTETVWVAEAPQEDGLPATPSVAPAQSPTQPPQLQAQAVGTAAAVASGGHRAASSAFPLDSDPGPGGGGTAEASGAAAAAPGNGSPRRAPGGAPGEGSAAPGSGLQGPSTTESGTLQPTAPGQPPAADKAARRKTARWSVKLGGLVHAAQEQRDPASAVGSPFRELVGSAYHLAPEALQGTGYGRAADIWAVGVLLYMMLTGRPPFPGRNELEVMTRVLLVVAETEASNSVNLESGEASAIKAGPSKTGKGWVTASRKGSVVAGTSSKSVGAASSVGTEGPVRTKLADTVQEVVLQAVLESCASAACREALAAMLEVDPARRKSAAELLQLPWFKAGEE